MAVSAWKWLCSVDRPIPAICARSSTRSGPRCVRPLQPVKFQHGPWIAEFLDRFKALPKAEKDWLLATEPKSPSAKTTAMREKIPAGYIQNRLVVCAIPGWLGVHNNGDEDAYRTPKSTTNGQVMALRTKNSASIPAGSVSSL